MKNTIKISEYIEMYAASPKEKGVVYLRLSEIEGLSQLKIDSEFWWIMPYHILVNEKDKNRIIKALG